MFPLYPNPRHLRAFVEVAECRSYSLAARKLGIGQPGLSQAIGKLEEVVGVKLLERTTRSVVLTRAGGDFLIDATRVLHEIDRLLQRGQEWTHAHRGYLSLLTLPSVAHKILPQVLGGFSRAYPGIKVAIHDHADYIVRQKMGRGEGDIAIVSESSALGGLFFLPLIRDEFRVVLSREHPLFGQEKFDMRSLADERLILQRQGMLLRQYVDSALSQLPLRFEPIEVNDMATAIAFAEANFGVALLPALACPKPTVATVASRPLSDRSLSRRIGFIRPANVALPSLIAFVDSFLDSISSHEFSIPEGVSVIPIEASSKVRILNNTNSPVGN